MPTKSLLLVLAAATLAGCMQQDDPGTPVATQDIKIPGQWIFEPKVAQVVAGEPVTWTNNGGAAHTVTIAELGLDENIPPGESFDYVFDEPGTYEYECVLHPPGMVGTIIVVAGQSNPDTVSGNVTGA